MKAFASDLDGTLFFDDIPGNFKDSDIRGIGKFKRKVTCLACALEGCTAA